MDDLKVICASNIIELRTKAGMTQLELAEKLNYSDKSVSKWERAEGMPDAYVLKHMSEIFGVTVDYILSTHDAWTPPPKKSEILYNTRIITHITIVGIWTLALLLFIIFWMLDMALWIVFIYAIPVSLIVLLVLHSIWEKGRYNYYIIGALVFSIIVSICITLQLLVQERNWMPLLIMVFPAGFIIYLTSRLKASDRKKK